MKRIIILLTCICLCFACVACGNTDVQKPTQNDTADITQETTPPEITEEVAEPEETVESTDATTEKEYVDIGGAKFYTGLDWDTEAAQYVFANDKLCSVTIPIPNQSCGTRPKGGGQIGYYTNENLDSVRILTSSLEENHTESSVYLEVLCNIVDLYMGGGYKEGACDILTDETITINDRVFRKITGTHHFEHRETQHSDYFAMYITEVSNGGTIFWSCADATSEQTLNDLVDQMTQRMAEGFKEI